MKAFGYTFEAWRAAPVCDRARLVAHELERGTRDSYRAAMDDARRAAQSNKSGGAPMNPFEAQKASWGL